MQDFVELSGEAVELPGAVMQIDDDGTPKLGVTELHMIPPAISKAESFGKERS